MDTRNILALLAVLAGSSLIAFVLYRRTSPTLSLRMRLVLGTLRWLAAFVALCLVIGPSLRLVRTTSSAPTIAVVVDDSRSMDCPDGGAKLDMVRSLLSADFVDALERKARLDFFAFSDSAGPLSASEAARPQATGARTDLVAGITSVLEHLDSKPAAIILVSDGGFNYGEDPLHFCSTLKVPIYPVSLAPSRPTPDISIDRIETNETAYAGSRVPVAVYVSGRSPVAGPTTLAMADSTGEVLRVPVNVPQSGARQRVDAEIDAGQVGIHSFTATLGAFDGEQVTANNSMDFSIRVMKGKIRVTLVAAHASWDLAFARRSLEEDSNVDLALVFSPGGAMAIKSQRVTNDLKRAIGASDVVIVLEGAVLGGAAGDLERFVWEGGSVLLVAPDASGDVPEAINPFVVSSYSRGTEPALYSPAPAEGGAGHEILDLEIARGGRLWSSLPPLPVDPSIGEAKPQATVLLTGVGDMNRRAGESQYVPLMAVMRCGMGKVVAFAGSELWRWDLVPRGFGVDVSAFRQLLTSCVRWLARRDETKRLALSAGQNDYLWGEPVTILARVADQDLRPLGGAVVETEVLDLESGLTVTRATMTERSPGGHLQVLDLLQPGRYTVKAKAAVGGKPYAEDGLSFSVSRRGLEDAGFDGDYALLGEIARSTGGRTYSADQAGTLPGDINPGRVIVKTYRDLRLRLNLAAFIVLAGLLGVEWLIRRRKMLA